MKGRTAPKRVGSDRHSSHPHSARHGAAGITLQVAWATGIADQRLLDRGFCARLGVLMVDGHQPGTRRRHDACQDGRERQDEHGKLTPSCRRCSPSTTTPRATPATGSTAVRAGRDATTEPMTSTRSGAPAGPVDTTDHSDQLTGIGRGIRGERRERPAAMCVPDRRQACPRAPAPQRTARHRTRAPDALPRVSRSGSSGSHRVLRRLSGWSGRRHADRLSLWTCDVSAHRCGLGSVDRRDFLVLLVAGVAAAVTGCSSTRSAVCCPRRHRPPWRLRSRPQAPARSHAPPCRRSHHRTPAQPRSSTERRSPPLKWHSR